MIQVRACRCHSKAALVLAEAQADELRKFSAQFAERVILAVVRAGATANRRHVDARVAALRQTHQAWLDGISAQLHVDVAKRTRAEHPVALMLAEDPSAIDVLCCLTVVSKLRALGIEVIPLC